MSERDEGWAAIINSHAAIHGSGSAYAPIYATATEQSWALRLARYYVREFSGLAVTGLGDEVEANMQQHLEFACGHHCDFATPPIEVHGHLDSLLAHLSDLRDRDKELFSTGQLRVGFGEWREVMAIDEDDEIFGRVGPVIGDNDAVLLLIPGGDEVYDYVLGVASELALSDRIRHLTELVRLLGNAIRFGGFRESVLRDAVRGLGRLCGVLRVLVAYGSEDRRDQGSECADDATDESDEFHDSDRTDQTKK